MNDTTMNKTEQNRTECEALTARQCRAIAALLVSATVEGAARTAGVSRTQLYAWLATPTFRAELARRRAEVFAETLSRLKNLSGKAVDALNDLLHAKNDARTRLGAVRVALDCALEIHERQDIETRLKALEERTQQGGTT